MKMHAKKAAGTEGFAVRNWDNFRPLIGGRLALASGGLEEELKN
jgi:hypothetical protein